MRFLAIFDGANATECYRRNESIVPQQALALYNSRLAWEQARLLAKRLSEEAAMSEEPADAFVDAVRGELSAARRVAFFKAAAQFYNATGPGTRSRKTLLNHWVSGADMLGGEAMRLFKGCIASTVQSSSNQT